MVHLLCACVHTKSSQRSPIDAGFMRAERRVPALAICRRLAGHRFLVARSGSATLLSRTASTWVFSILDQYSMFEFNRPHKRFLRSQKKTGKTDVQPGGKTSCCQTPINR